MPPVYPFAIQSIPDKHPGLPHTISGINIHHPIEQGQPLNPDDLNDAKIKAGFLKGYHRLGISPEIITEEVVRSAELRATAIKNIHASAEYTPTDIPTQQLVGYLSQKLGVINERVVDVDQRLQELQRRFDVLNDQVARQKIEAINGDIRTRNLLIGLPDLYPLQKSVAGSGVAIAQSISANLGEDIRNMLNEYANAGPPAEIGTTPPFVEKGVYFGDLEHIDILKLVCFYNEDMGISAGDGIVERRRFVQKFLNGL